MRGMLCLLTGACGFPAVGQMRLLGVGLAGWVCCRWERSLMDDQAPAVVAGLTAARQQVTQKSNEA